MWQLGAAEATGAVLEFLDLLVKSILGPQYGSNGGAGGL